MREEKGTQKLNGTYVNKRNDTCQIGKIRGKDFVLVDMPLRRCHFAWQLTCKRLVILLRARFKLKMRRLMRSLPMEFLTCDLCEIIID